MSRRLLEVDVRTIDAFREARRKDVLMNGVFRGVAVIISGVLAASLVLVGEGSAATVKPLRRARMECPEKALCAYSEEELFGDMSTVSGTDPDLTDEQEHEVFFRSVESLLNNSDCTARLYSRTRFRGERAELKSGERISNIKTVRPALKHHIYSVKLVDCSSG